MNEEHKLTSVENHLINSLKTRVLMKMRIAAAECNMISSEFVAIWQIAIKEQNTITAMNNKTK